MAHNVLVRAIRHAERDDLVRRNVAALAKPPKGQRGGRPSKSLTLEQAVALMAAAPGHVAGDVRHLVAAVRRVRTLMPMIWRLWRGWTTKDNADAYERIVRGQVIPGIEARRIPGFRSIDLARRERDRDVEFMTLMWFDSLESVKEFMGEDYEVAHVPAEAQAVLTDFDKRSAHYEVLDHREQSR